MEMMILHSEMVVIVLAADDNHSWDDDYSLHPNFSKQAAVAVAKEAAAHRGSTHDVR